MTDGPVAAPSGLTPGLSGALLELARAVNDGRMTAADHALACLERARAVEPMIHAFKGLDEAAVLARASAADAMLEAAKAARDPAGAARLPLAGIPFGVKDIIDVCGEITGMGSPIHDNDQAGADARLVAKLKAAGGWVFAKTVTTEFAFMHPRETRNPWHTGHTPGGSSSGSAAAVAAGCVPAALATQTNGSVIRPAAFCGIVGFKPSLGAFSAQGLLSYAPTLDQPGCHARSVADIALIAQALAEPDWAIGPDLMPRAAPPRLLAVRSPVWSQASAQMQAAFERSCARLAAAGAAVHARELPPKFDAAHDVHRVIMGFEAVRYFTPVQAAHRARISDWLNRYLDQAASISEATYRDALAARAALRSAFAAFLVAHDALLTPPAPGEAPSGIETSGDPVFCSIWTLLGVPAITLPIGFGPACLPLGLQIVGPERGDGLLLEIARWCEMQFAFAGQVAGPR